MHRFTATIFNDHVLALKTHPAYSDERWAQRLGTFDQLAVAAVVDHPDTPGGVLNVLLEHSADGRVWDEKTHTPCVSGTVLNGAQTQLSGGDTSGLPNLAFVRLKFY